MHLVGLLFFLFEKEKIDFNKRLLHDDCDLYDGKQVITHHIQTPASFYSRLAVSNHSLSY